MRKILLKKVREAYLNNLKGMVLNREPKPSISRNIDDSESVAFSRNDIDTGALCVGSADVATSSVDQP